MASGTQKEIISNYMKHLVLKLILKDWFGELDVHVT